MTGYRWLWVTWIVAGLVLEFGAILRRRYADTLSEFLWHLCKVTPGSTIASWTAVHLFVVVFLLWLLVHIGFGLFR